MPIQPKTSVILPKFCWSAVVSPTGALRPRGPPGRLLPRGAAAVANLCMNTWINHRTSIISVRAHLRWYIKSKRQQSEHSFPRGKSDYFHQPLPPIQCWQGRMHPSMQRSNIHTSDHGAINFENTRNFPILEKSRWCLQHWIGGRGWKISVSFGENKQFVLLHWKIKRHACVPKILVRR